MKVSCEIRLYSVLLARYIGRSLVAMCQGRHMSLQAQYVLFGPKQISRMTDDRMFVASMPRTALKRVGAVDMAHECGVVDRHTA